MTASDSGFLPNCRAGHPASHRGLLSFPMAPQLLWAVSLRSRTLRSGKMPEFSQPELQHEVNTPDRGRALPWACVWQGR